MNTSKQDLGQKRRAFTISIVFLIAILANLVLSISLGRQTGAWQQYVRAVIVVAFGIAALIAARKIQHDQVREGVWLIIYGLTSSLVGSALLLAGLGLILAIIELVLVGSVALFALNGSDRKKSQLYSIGTAVLIILLDFAPLNYRVPAPTEISAGLPTIAGVVVLLVVGITIGTNRAAISSFWNSSIRNRLTTIILATAIIPVLLLSGILGVTTYTQVRASLINDTFDRLDAIESIKTRQLSDLLNRRKSDMTALSDAMGSLLNETLNKMEALNTLKRDQIIQLFNTWDADVRDVASDPGVVAGMKELANSFQALGSAQVRALYLDKSELETAGDESAYNAAHLEQHSFFRGYIDIHGYEDAYLIDLDGNVVYSVNKTNAFATNLAAGPYQDSSLAKLYQNLISTETGTSYIADVNVFGDEFAMFIGAPIYDGSQLVGMLAYRLPLDRINTIMAERTGQGQTGGSFLLAMDEEGNISYRSNRTSLGNEKYVVGYDITDIASKSMLRALNGQSGGGLIAASTGETRINAYKPLDIPGLNWAVFTSVNAIEALSPIHITGNKDYLKAYRDNYNYYDIFLIHPNGTIFYTAKQEADFQTNILTGKFSDSNLATLVNEVLEEKETRFIDFDFYKPSGGEPAAFFGSPLLNSEGDVVLIIATQLSKEDINNIMNEASGLGETGESYIIGQDFLGRMDSRFIAALGVKTTILNPSFAVDTEAVRAALAGKAGQGTIIDYRGLPVLSVWQPLVIHKADSHHPEGQVWAVMTEIDESEALQSAQQLAGSLGLLIGLAALIIGATAVFIGTRFAVNFVEPILTLTDTATQVAEGNLNLRLATDSKDEIGTLTNTFNDMTAQLQETLEGLEGRVAARTKDLETVANISTVTATIRNSEEMLTNMVQLTQRGFDLYHAHVFTFGKENDMLKIVACGYQEGDEHEGTHGVTTIPLGQEQSLVALCARTRQPVIVNDVRNEPGWLPNAELPETRAELAVPMIVGDELLGVLDVQADHTNAFSEEDANIQLTLASQIATALQNIQTYEQAQKRAELETLANVIGQRIQRTTSIEGTLQTAIRELGTAIGASRVKASLKPAPIEETGDTEVNLVSEAESLRENEEAEPPIPVNEHLRSEEGSLGVEK